MTAQLLYSLSVFSDGSISVGDASRPPLWRVKHDWERSPQWRASVGNRHNVPEVYVLQSSGAAIPLPRAWQELTYALNQPGMDGSHWRVLYGYWTAFTNNGAGYDYPGSAPKQDWINMRDTTARELPRFDKPRICGGAIVTGTVEGDRLRLHYLDATKAPPAVEDVKTWEKFVALNVVDADTLSRFPQRGGLDVWIPLIGREPMWLPLEVLQPWTAEGWPDPYKIYLK